MTYILGLIATAAFLALASCGENKTASSPYGSLSEDYFDSISDKALKTSPQLIHRNIIKISQYDINGIASDRRAREHYLHHKDSPDAFLWIDFNGVSRQADSLLACLDSCEKEGISSKSLRLERIRSDMNIVKTLAFTDKNPDDNDIDMVLARLEYNLTRAFLRYAVGQRYGFTNPKQYLNRLDIRDSDSVRTTYRTLFDIPIHIKGPVTFHEAIRSVRNDSAGWYLRQAMNHSRTYTELKKCLDSPQTYDREKVLVNMERARWQPAEMPDGNDDHIIVNIPSFRLWAMRNGIPQIDTRICCGAVKTKTPLLYSRLKRMDVNPLWIIPMSIRKNELARHVGDANYFLSRNYYAQNKKTGKKLTGEDITWNVITSGEWSVIQKGGQGNSLGRIIFRFDNNFSIYIHDTSSRSAFEKGNRAVSHGCIRVENPYELARYLLNGNDDETAEKIKYSMEADLMAPDTKASKLVHSVNISPQIPLSIVYYTLYPIHNKVESFPDIYGYDVITGNELKKCI